MRASQIQRVLLYAILLPLALLTCIWYLLTVIGTCVLNLLPLSDDLTSVDSGTASSLADSGLGPIGLGSGGVVRGGSGDVPLNSAPLYTSTVITSYGPRTSWGDYPDTTSRKVFTYVPTETVTRTLINGDIGFYTYDGLSTYYTPTTVTRYGYQTITDWYTTTSRGYQYAARALPTAANAPAHEPAPLTDDTATPAPAPTPAPQAAAPIQKRAVPERHDLVKRRRGGGGGGGGGSISGEDAEAAFMSYIPNFLGLFWSFAVILWLLILPCTSGAPRSIASMSKTLLCFWVIGAASSLWTSIVIGVAAGRGSYVWGLWVCILVFAWLLTIALFGAWLWLRLWSRKHAKGQLYRSIESVEQDGVQDNHHVDPSNMGKGDGTPQPPQLAYAAYPGAYPTPPPPGTDPMQAYGQPISSVSPASPGSPPPAAPAGYVYALVPVPNGVQSSPSPPPTTPAIYPANMYQPQPVHAQGPQGPTHP